MAVQTSGRGRGHRGDVVTRAYDGRGTSDPSGNHPRSVTVHLQ